MRPLFSLTAALMLVGASVGAQDEVLTVPYQRMVLPNGLTVILHEDHSTPMVAVNLWYHVAPAREAPGRTGFAHLFEHLMFRRARSRARERIRRVARFEGKSRKEYRMTNSEWGNVEVTIPEL
jgi:predicted Zn-dependent peptidase